MKIIDGDHYITQKFGLTAFAQSSQGKSFYKNFPGGIHPGIDFGTRGKKLPVLSPVTGEVVRASWDGGWGYHIEVKAEKDGWNRQFSHLSAVNVRVGQKVRIGDLLGNVGTTGSSTAVHLHFGHRRKKTLGGWEYRDPSIDLVDSQEEDRMPTEKLIKAEPFSAVYVFNGKEKFPIPNWGTLTFLFGEKAKIEVIDEATLDKIPTGPIIPQLA